jgi:aryl-alcohol dehydrogenase-like predicted oxidoreductase
MRTIAVGRSKVQSSVMGLGCMGMSEFYGARDDDESLRTLERAFDLGVTHYDTSNVYGRGHNESLLARFLKGRRDKLTIASKFGVVRDPDGPDGSTYDRGIDNSPAYMRECLDGSLKRLQTDVIDLYYVHRADPKVPIEDTVGALGRLVGEGKIRAIGLSEVTAQQLRRACGAFPVAALQSEYSLWTREPELDVLPACDELGVTFVAYSPLGRGFLTGAIDQADSLAPDDFRLTSPRFQGENFLKNLELLRRVKRMCDARGCLPGQAALAWLHTRRPGLLSIPGTKRVKYLEQNVAALDVQLTKDDLALLEECFPVGGAAGSRYDPNFEGAPKPDQTATRPA